MRASAREDPTLHVVIQHVVATYVFPRVWLSNISSVRLTHQPIGIGASISWKSDVIVGILTLDPQVSIQYNR